MNLKFSQAVLPLVIFLSLLIREGLSIRCFVCNSHENAQCNDPVKYKDDPQLSQECDGNATMCRKIEQHIEIDGEEQIRIHRECAVSGDLGDCLERTGTYKFKSWYCQCKNEDYCNSGSFSSFSMLVTGAALSSVYLLRKLL